MLEQPGRDFDRQFGTDYQPGWVKEEVLEKVKQGRERVILARLEVMLWEGLCKQFENPAARGEGEERGSGLEASGEVFERGSHVDEEEEEEQEEDEDWGPEWEEF